jgi:hypothetical protein
MITSKVSSLSENILKTPSNKIVNSVSALFSIGLFAYLILMERIVQPDLKFHILFSEQFIEGKMVLGHPTFFFLLQFFAGFTMDPDLEIFSSFLILAISQFLKIIFSLELICLIFKIQNSWLLFALVLICQLVIGSSLLYPHYIIGNISPNYFHNGTLSLSLPFSILFLIQTFKYINDDKSYKVSYIILLGFLKHKY